MTYVMNYPKNATKHMDSKDDGVVTFTPKKAAKSYLDRAVKNFYFLLAYVELEETEHIQRFQLELVDI